MFSVYVSLNSPCHLASQKEPSAAISFLRVTAIALGIIACLVGIFALNGTWGHSCLNKAMGGTLLAGGFVTFSLGFILNYNEKPLVLPPPSKPVTKTSPVLSEAVTTKISPPKDVDFTLSEQLLSKINTYLQNPLKPPSDMYFYPARTGHLVFSLNEVPHLIFKVENYGHEMKERLNKITFAQKICKDHNLSLLVVPLAKLIEMKVVRESGEMNFEILVEERLDVENASLSDEAVRQLVTFIALTGHDDLLEHNRRIIKNTERVALYDVEFILMNPRAADLWVQARDSLVELMKIVKKPQQNIILTEAKRLQLDSDFIEYKALRSI